MLGSRDRSSSSGLLLSQLSRDGGWLSLASSLKLEDSDGEGRLCEGLKLEFEKVCTCFAVGAASFERRTRSSCRWDGPRPVIVGRELEESILRDGRVENGE